MSNVIAFLESLGKNAALAGQSTEDYAAAVNGLGLDDAPRQALLDRDAAVLGGLLGGRMKMMCLLFPADGDDNKKDDEQEDESEPSQDERKESVRRNGKH